MHKLFITILSLGLLFSCGNKKAEVKTEPATDTNQTLIDTNTTTPLAVKADWESVVMDTIMSLPEVIKLGEDIEKNSKGKNHLTALITETPEDNGNDYYGVKVGEDNGESVVGIYNFTVYTPSLKIIYSDPISGDDLTLDEWRKQR